MRLPHTPSTLFVHSFTLRLPHRRRPTRKVEGPRLHTTDPLVAKYEAMSVAQLKEVLAINGVSATTDEERADWKQRQRQQLVARCCTGERNGAPPFCPKCAAKLKPLKRSPPVLKLTVRGYRCPGYWDAGANKSVPCSFDPNPGYEVRSPPAA